MAKYKMTLFARFFIFLIIIIPVAYILAAYINGQDGIGKLLSIFDEDQQDSTEIVSPPPPAADTNEVKSIEKNKLLQQKVDSIQLLRQQLEDCRDTSSEEN